MTGNSLNFSEDSISAKIELALKIRKYQLAPIKRKKLRLYFNILENQKE